MYTFYNLFKFAFVVLVFFCYFQVLNVFLNIALNLYKFSLKCFDFV